jgi:hypothetical protein
MRFGTWNVRSLYRSASHTTAARELASCKLGLVGALERLGVTNRAQREQGIYFFLYGTGIENMYCEQDFCTTQNSFSSYVSRVS